MTFISALRYTFPEMRANHVNRTNRSPDSESVTASTAEHVEHVLTDFFRLFAVIGFVAYVPSMWGAISSRLWAIAVVDTIAYAVIVYAALSRGLSSHKKLAILIVVSLGVGTTVLIGTGMSGAGYIWLMAAAIFSAIFGSVKVIVASIAAVCGILGAYVLFVVLGHIETDSSIAIVGIVTSNLVLVSIAVSYVLHSLLSRLGCLADAQVRLSQHLNAELEDNIAVRKSLDTTLQAKRNVLRELDHRVRNNLQIVLSLMSMVPNDAAGIRELRSRVLAISAVHDSLDPAGNALEVDIADVLAHAFATVRSDFDRPGLTWHIARSEAVSMVGIDVAINVSIAATEILTNSARHAEGDEVEILLDFNQDGDCVVIVLTDTGRPPETGWGAKTVRGAGTALIEGLFEQAGATVTVTQSSGTRYVVRLPLTSARRTS
ncbi:MAG: sensor histidine kinase [Spirochaetaceae bacterium]|nr:MAG: sensor histidine kinase [Spirochaetaceae bacterium]